MINALIVLAAIVWLIAGIFVLYRIIYWDRMFSELYNVGKKMYEDGDFVPYDKIKEIN